MLQLVREEARLGHSMATQHGSAAVSVYGCCAHCSCCVDAGVTSQVAEVRAMGLDMIAKMVKASGPAQIQPHLADLSVTMLESLSGMEVCSSQTGLNNAVHSWMQL